VCSLRKDAIARRRPRPGGRRARARPAATQRPGEGPNGKSCSTPAQVMPSGTSTRIRRCVPSRTRPRSGQLVDSKYLLAALLTPRVSARPWCSVAHWRTATSRAAQALSSTPFYHSAAHETMAAALVDLHRRPAQDLPHQGSIPRLTTGHGAHPEVKRANGDRVVRRQTITLHKTLARLEGVGTS